MCRPAVVRRSAANRGYGPKRSWTKTATELSLVCECIFARRPLSCDGDATTTTPPTIQRNQYFEAVQEQVVVQASRLQWAAETAAPQTPNLSLRALRL